MEIVPYFTMPVTLYLKGLLLMEIVPYFTMPVTLYLKGLLLMEIVPYFTMPVTTTWIPGVVSRGGIVFTDFQFALRKFGIMITCVR